MPQVKTIVRWGGIVLGSLAALVLLAGGVLFFLLSQINMKAEVERAVEGATGRQLTIQGNVGVTFWPVLGVRAERASLANVPGGRAAAFVTADEIDVGVDLIPLFHHQIIVRQVVLQHPRIALEIDAQGRPNWVLRAANEHPGAVERTIQNEVQRTINETPPAQQGANAPPPGFTLKKLSISEGEFSYYDARRNMGWVLSDADLDSAITSLDTPMRIDGVVTYNARRVSATVTVQQPRNALRGQGADLTAEIRSELLQALFHGHVGAVSGEFGGDLHAEGPHLRYIATWAGSPILGGVGLEDFAVSGNIAVAPDRFSFSNAGFAVDRLRGRGDFDISKRHGKPYVSGRIQLFDLDLNPYLTGQMPAPPANAAAPPSGQPAAPNALDAQIAVVSPSDRTLDVQGRPNDRVIDFSGLSAVNADLDITTSALLIQHLRIDHAKLDLVMNDGHAAATIQELGLYGGSASGRMEIDARQSIPRFVQDLTFRGLDAQRFLGDAINYTNVEGRTELSYRIVTRGRTPQDLIANADGTGHVEVVSGVLHGVDLGGVTRTIGNALNHHLIEPAARSPFNGFSASFAIHHGALASENLSFNTPQLAVPGIGVVDLAQHTLDVRLAPRPPRGGIAIPFTVRGPFTQPRFNSDIRRIEQRQILTQVHAVQAGARAAQ